MLDEPLMYLNEEEMEFSAANRTVPIGAGPSEVQLQGIMHILPQFCTECAQRLSNCSKFRNKCRTAYHLLLEFIEMNELLTAHEFLSVRRSNNLTSRISKKSFPPDFCDLYLIHEEQEDHGIQKELQNNKLSLNPDLEYDDKNEDVEFIQEQQLPNSKEIKIEVECVNGKRILNPFPENEDIIYEKKTENFDDFQTNVEYLEDIDVDIDIDIDRDEGTKKVKKVDKCINGMDNNCFHLSDSHSDNYLESDVVNNESYTENVKVMPAKYAEGKIKVIERSKKPKYTKVLGLELSKEYKRVAEKVDTSMNDVVNVIENNRINLKDCDNDCKSGLVNNENIDITPTNCSNGKTTVVKARKLKSMNKIKKDRSAIETVDLSSQYTITRLTLEEQISDVQKRKEKQSFKNKPYKCMTCFKGFHNANVYKTHMETHTDKCGKFVCTVCEVHYEKRHKLNRHMASSHSTRYSCNTCKLVTGDRTVAQGHLKRHKGVTYSCPHCPYQLRSRTGYFSHLRIAHPSDAVCHLCGYSFVNQNGLEQHLRLKHRHDNVPNPAGPLCEPCNIRFASEAAYQKHLQVSPKHAAGKHLKRNDSQSETEKLNRLIARRPAITRSRGADKTAVRGPTKVACEQCDKQLDGFRSYAQHFRIHHPGKIRTRFSHCKISDDGSAGLLHLCDICGISYGNRHCLDSHMISKHSGKKEFQCDICKKYFYLRSRLQVHIRSHEAQYECPVCHKKFNNDSNCRRHTMIHSEVKPVKCDMCDKTFVNESTMRVHVQHAHLKKPYPARPSRAKRKQHRGLVDIR